MNTETEVFPIGPLTQYFAAFVFRQKVGDKWLLLTSLFAVSGHDPLTLDEFWARHRKMVREEWDRERYGDPDDYEEILNEGKFAVHVSTVEARMTTRR
jgi:hypothetical protein